MVTANKFLAVTLIIFLRQSQLCTTQNALVPADNSGEIIDPKPPRAAENQTGLRCSIFSSGPFGSWAPMIYNVCIALLSALKPPVCSPMKTTCLGCLNLQICYEHENGSFITVELPCKDENPKTPYCDTTTGTCVDNDASCDHGPDVANCYGEGIIPDPLNCKQYFNCADKDKDAMIRSSYTGFIYTCPDGAYAYDHISKTCRLSQKCWDFTEKNLCLNKANKFVAYPPDSSIYVRCPPANLGLKPTVYKCKGSYLYNPVINACDAICTKETKLKDNLSCDKYYECIKASTGFIRQIRFCPSGQHFLEDKQKCERPENPACEPIEKPNDKPIDKPTK